MDSDLSAAIADARANVRTTLYVVLFLTLALYLLARIVSDQLITMHVMARALCVSPQRPVPTPLGGQVSSSTVTAANTQETPAKDA